MINGLPHQFAPFSSFTRNGKYIGFTTLNNYFNEIVENGENLIVFATDGSGNPFCFDKNSNHKIILLDLETEKGVAVNESFAEFLLSISEYRNFINSVQEKYGKNAFLDCLYTDEEIEMLKTRLLEINKNFSSEFWDEQVESLLSRA